MNFLEKLDYMMKKLSINKKKLSEISGVPYTTIDGFYKKGYENAKLSTIRKIASALNVSLDYLIDDGIEDENYGKKPSEDAKKSPDAEESAPGDDAATREELVRVLIRLGFIGEDQQLSDRDLAFLGAVFTLLDTWFRENR